MRDWEGKLLDEANAKKDSLPAYVPVTYEYNLKREWVNNDIIMLESVIDVYQLLRILLVNEYASKLSASKLKIYEPSLAII